MDIREMDEGEAARFRQGTHPFAGQVVQVDHDDRLEDVVEAFVKRLNALPLAVEVFSIGDEPSLYVFIQGDDPR